MKIVILIFIGLTWLSCNSQTKNDEVNLDNMEVATLGAGCFWCVEAVFSELNGVVSVTSGYTGGEMVDPTYKEVCSGKTGHAEVAQIVFDPNVISFEEILEVFWQTHDPTTYNRQGNDVGSQYRSVIYYSTQKQKETAEFYKDELNKSKAWENEVITEVSELGVFYPAEDYHQDYFELNGEQQYCKYVIQPKLDKFRKAFASKLK